MHRFCNWALGLAFDANWANSTGKSFDSGATNLPLPPPPPPPGPNQGPVITQTGRSKAHLENSLQLYARGGYVIGSQTLAFIKLGWDNSEWKNSVHTITSNPAMSMTIFSNAHKRKRFNGLLWGAGIDLLATKRVVVGFEYTGTIAGRKRLGGKNSNLRASFRPQYNRIAVTAKFFIN